MTTKQTCFKKMKNLKYQKVADFAEMYIMFNEIFELITLNKF